MRDHLVAAPVKIEQVDVIAAEQGGERIADIGHGDTEPVRFVVIDIELDLRRLEAQVRIGENEQPAFLGRFLDIGEHVSELAEVARRGDDELHRRPAGGAGERRRREGQRNRRRQTIDARRQILQHLFLVTLPLAPGLEQDADKALVHIAHSVDGEDVLLFRHGAVDAVKLLGRVFQIIEIGVLRCLHQGEQDALVFLRREFLLCCHIHEARGDDDACQHQHGHRAIIERSVQAPLIASLQSIE